MAERMCKALILPYMRPYSYQVQVNNQWEGEISSPQQGLPPFAGPHSWSLVPLDGDRYSIIWDHRQFLAEKLALDPATKTLTLRISGRIFEVRLREPLDLLVESLGTRLALKEELLKVRAPMPGLILSVLVRPGQELRQGEPMLILEAMKMENVFKAASAARVLELKVREGEVVEKGSVLLVLEPGEERKK